ncbi:MAG: DUF2309 domain-containing protein [Saprospiraceae bacterium]|nr:DUF2309 domain-containing protein [Saprospiraceae bacterium]
MGNMSSTFNEHQVLHDLAHHLPSQTPLKDFIHHNTLHAFQHLPFYEAIIQAGRIFGYNVTFNVHEYRSLHKVGRIRDEVLDMVIRKRKGEAALATWRENCLVKQYTPTYDPRIGKLRANWKRHYHLDLDNLVQPLLFRIAGSYLDQGIAIWQFPFEERGLLNAVREVERNSFASFFRTKRVRQLLFDESLTLEKMLDRLVGDPRLYGQYLFDQQFGHRGWSGMMAAIEANPHSILYQKKVQLYDFIHLELLLELDNLDAELGTDWLPLAKKVSGLEPIDLFAPVPGTELQEVKKIWQDAFEWSYYDEVLSGLRQARLAQKASKAVPDRRSFQAILCLDEREGSLRRHLESLDADCETLGCPGFFGVEFFFHPWGGKFYEKLCPITVTPKYLIKEKEAGVKHEDELLYTKDSHKFFRGVLASLSLGLWSAIKLLLQLAKPEKNQASKDAFAHMSMDAELVIEHEGQQENGLQVGFTIVEMADRVEGLLRGIGMVQDFAPLVYVVAHGSSSANNPHHGAYDCGACSGRPGSVNARVFAFMANHVEVRKLLKDRGLEIPFDTIFVGALHDTSSEEMVFYDDKSLYPDTVVLHEKNKVVFENALDLNAKERSRRFASIDVRQDIHKVREAIRQRSVSYFEPRPELGHSTNALCFVGHRNLTKRLFLDRRAFMNSYDYRTDPDGQRLLGVLRPIPPVCGGINLEYYFSRVDNQKLGAGAKLPHNVMGLVGVANSSDGDLRTGLPKQMVEAHDPMRLLVMVEHEPAVVLRTIQAEPSLYEWFANGWVHLVAIHPTNHSFHYFENGQFAPYEPLNVQVPTADDIHGLIENAPEMKSNYIVHATKENLPVHIIKTN